MEGKWLAEMAWPEVEALLARDDRLLLVAGATEQHGRHLPLATDTLIPAALAARLSARSGVPIAPPLPYGMSEAHMAFPGTFTLSEETLRALYLEVVQSAYRQGWRRLFVLNGHGGNRAAWEWVAALAAKIKQDLRIYLGHWWTEPVVRELVRAEMGRNEGHAGLEETAAVLRAHPGLVTLAAARGTAEVDDSVWEGSPDAVRAAVPHGAIGSDPAAATPALGERILAAVVAEYLPLLEGEWGADPQGQRQ